MENNTLTNPNTDKDLFLYAVLRLQTEVEHIDPITNNSEYRKLEGLAGYMPVFHTIEEAEQASESGKYQIRPVRSYLSAKT